MPLADGQIFAGYTILRILGGGRYTWQSIRGCPPGCAEGARRRQP